jgi:hypothetical protein
VLKIVYCTKKSDKSFAIATENMNKSVTNNGDNSYYEIITANEEDCKNYVNGLNYISQLVKAKFFAFKGSDKK